MTALGLVLGLTVCRKFLVLPFVAQAMLLLHALQGWYPLLPVLRRLGFRTPTEIERERARLEASRVAASPASGNGRAAVHRAA